MTQDIDSTTLKLRDGNLILPPAKSKGTIKVDRVFSSEDKHPYDAIAWKHTDLEIKDWQKGTVRFKRDQVEHPAHWDYTSVLVTADKYLFGTTPGTPEYEDSLRHAFDRLANTYTIWAWEEGYIGDLESLQIFNEELKYMLVMQVWAPNSPVWFNIGHIESWRWGRPDLRPTFKNMSATAFYTDSDTDIKALPTTPMDHPQCSACFLTEVNDSMESILDHLKTEGRVFSNGSGVGINLSSLRSSVEPITGKGVSSGPISFDRGFDRMAGAIKSGGKTRRAARMVLLNSDHPDIFKFVRAKNEQEEIGKIILREHNVRVQVDRLAAAAKTPAEKLAAKIVNGMPRVNSTQYSTHMDDLLYGETLSNQNANHSVSLKGEFWSARKSGSQYATRWVTDPSRTVEKFDPDVLLDEMSQAAHANAEPGVHMNDWINLWNPVKSDGNITTSNPCSEYLMLNNTSCNLASFNAYRFRKEDGSFDGAKLKSACFLAMICADLNVQRGGFPIPEIAEGTRRYRTTGIGFTNLGGLLMSLGLPYDSDAGRYLTSNIVSLLSASCIEASSIIAKAKGPYEAYVRTAKDLGEVINLHRACHSVLSSIGEASSVDRVKAQFPLDKLPEAQGLNGHDAIDAFASTFESMEVSDYARHFIQDTCQLASETWLKAANASTYRNCFVTVLAPTGTISAPLGSLTAGTTSGEPDYSLIKNKSLSGGGNLRMFNSLALEGLRTLGYSEYQIREAALEAAGIDGLLVACGSPEEAKAHLSASQGEPGPVRVMADRLRTINGVDGLLKLANKAMDPSTGPDEKLVAGGKEHLEAVPWIKPEDLPVFDCAATAGDGTRSISPDGHLRMLGALQPFLSGSMSKTVNLPYSATVEDIKQSFVNCHRWGVKCIALFRAESKAISVYASDTVEGRKWDAQRIWTALVKDADESLKEELQKMAKPRRRKLRGRRLSQTLKFEIAGGQQEGFITVSTYPDGRCGEVFLRIGQGGTFIAGALDAFAKSISMQLQYGVPIEEILHSFAGMAFDPAGFCKVGDDSEDERVSDIKSASSVIDLLMKTLDWLFPESGGRRLRDLNEYGAMQEEFIMPDYQATVEVSPSGNALKPSKPKGNAAICPNCGQATLIQDGHCKSCINPSCGYKDGGCGS